MKIRAQVALCLILGSGGEIGYQLYKEFGAGKLDGVNFQGATADEAQHAGHGLWRLDTAWAALKQTQAGDKTQTSRIKTAKWI